MMASKMPCFLAPAPERGVLGPAHVGAVDDESIGIGLERIENLTVLLGADRPAVQADDLEQVVVARDRFAGAAVQPGVDDQSILDPDQPLFLQLPEAPDVVLELQPPLGEALDQLVTETGRQAVGNEISPDPPYVVGPGVLEFGPLDVVGHVRWSAATLHDQCPSRRR